MSDVKRVTAMSFEDQDDDFLQNAKLTSPDQRSQKPDDEKNSHITTKPDSHLTGDPAENPPKPARAQDLKSSPSAPTGNDPVSSQKGTISSSQPHKPENQKFSDSHQNPQIGSMTHKAANSIPTTQEEQKPTKKKRIKKTDAERLQIMNEKLAKLHADIAQQQEEAEILQQKIELAKKTPEERRQYERSLDTHCKVLAGAIVINLYNDKNKKFDRETLKNLLLDSLSRSEDITYFKKKLHE